MGIYLSILKTAFKKNFAYRKTLVFQIIESIVFILAQIAVWNYVYKEDNSKIRYMIAYVIISRIISILYIHDIVRIIGERVKNGDIAMSLLKPLNIPISFISESVGNMLAKLMINGTILFIIFLPFILGEINLNALNLLLLFTMSILNLIFINLLMVIEGLLTFVLIESWALIYATDKALLILSGAIIPLSFYPPWLSNLLLYTPFPYLYSFPIRLMLGDISYMEIVSSILNISIWILIILLTLKLTYNKFLRRTIIQGG